MAFRSQMGASRPGAHRPPTRRDRRNHFPDLSPRPQVSTSTARVVLDPRTSRRFEVRQLPGRVGDRALNRFELRTEGLPAAYVADYPDYPECSCDEFRESWECVHLRVLASADLIVEARFALTSESTACGKGVGDGRR